MKIIVGLGNPGPEYAHTRHNTGWIMLDRFAAYNDTPADWHERFDSLLAEFGVGVKKYILVKPQTFMNRSGTAIQQIIQFYKLDPSKDLLVVHDDIDLRLGTWKNTDRSSSAGHKGVQDIFDTLGTQDFTRIRVGIDTRVDRDSIPTENFVLEQFSPDEEARLVEIFPAVAQHLRTFLDL